MGIMNLCMLSLCVFMIVWFPKDRYNLKGLHIYLQVFWQTVSSMMDDVFIGGQFSEVVVWALDWKTRLHLMDIHSHPELTAG